MGSRCMTYQVLAQVNDCTHIHNTTFRDREISKYRAAGRPDGMMRLLSVLHANRRMYS